MLIEIIQGSDEVKEIRDRETREIKGLTQEVYFHLPDSAYPVRGKMRVETRLQLGKYEMQPVFKIGKYGDLEIFPFEVPKVKPARPEQVKAAAGQ